MSESRMKLCLNGIWEMSEGGSPDTIPSDGWKNIRVPEGYGDWARTSAWYRLRFPVPESFRGNAAQLEVGRIRFYGKALLNGEVCGESWQPRNPLIADVTRLIRPGETNELHVFAHCLAEGYSNPGEPLQDAGARGTLLDYYDSHDQAGVKGDVFIASQPACRIEDVHIVPSVQNRRLTAHITARNSGLSTVKAVVRAEVRLSGESVLALEPVSVQIDPGEQQSVTLASDWTDPVLWGPPPHGERVLYHLQSELETDGSASDRRFDRFGFRELWVEDDHFIFNGNRVFMMGTQVCGLEMREPMSLLIPRLQEAGFLFVHPHAVHRLQGFYDVCDEMGMLVWDCTYCAGPIGNDFKRWDPDQKGPLERALPYHEDAYRAWVRQNRNHPCVAIWSAGCNNRHIHDPLRKIIRAEDPSSRPITTYCDPEGDREVFMFGFSWKRGDDGSPDFSSGLEDIDRERKARGDRTYPLFIAEYWGGSGIPKCMDESYERGVAGGATFEVGGYQGNLPPLSGDFDIDWPAESGVGQRRRNLIKLGHKVTHSGSPRHPNWCDPKAPVFAGEWEQLADYRALSEKSGGGLQPAAQRAPEVIVTVTGDGSAVSHINVTLYPDEDQSMNPRGVLTDLNGRAWFILQEPGRYRAVCDGGETTFTASIQPLEQVAGYDYIQQVEIRTN